MKRNILVHRIYSYSKLIINEKFRRPLAALRLSLRYHCYVHPSCYMDYPNNIVLAPGVNVGEGVHLRCPGNATIRIGRGTLINPYCVLRADSGKIVIGEGCSLQYNSTIYGTGGVDIGNETRIAAHVLILATNHKHDDPKQPIVRQGITGKGIHVGSNVWIGAGSIVLDGVTINSHSIVGAGSVVTKNVPESCLVVGNPAHVVKKYV